MSKMELGFNPYDKKNEVFDSYNQNGRANFLNSFKLAAGLWVVFRDTGGSDGAGPHGGGDPQAHGGLLS